MRRRVPISLAAVLGLVLLQPAVGNAATGYTLQFSKFGTTYVLDRWNPCQRDIVYRVNAWLAAGTYVGRQAAIADVIAAVDLVHEATGINFRYAGTTPYIPTGPNWANSTTSGGEPAEIVIAWTDARHPSTLLAGGAAGTGGFALRARTITGGTLLGNIGRGFVLLNAAQNRYFKPGFGGGVTRGELLLHEIGHAMGLGHTGLRTQIMYPVMISRTTTRYGSYDLAGLARLGRKAGCVNIPGLWQDLS